MKKIWTFFTLCIITLSFTACASKNTNNNDSTISDDTAASSETVYFEATVLEIGESYQLRHRIWRSV